MLSHSNVDVELTVHSHGKFYSLYEILAIIFQEPVWCWCRKPGDSQLACHCFFSNLPPCYNGRKNCVVYVLWSCFSTMLVAENEKVHMVLNFSLLPKQNPWIRQYTVGFVCAVTRTLSLADIQCKLKPMLQPYLKHPVIEVDKEVVCWVKCEKQFSHCSIRVILGCCPELYIGAIASHRVWLLDQAPEPARSARKSSRQASAAFHREGWPSALILRDGSQPQVGKEISFIRFCVINGSATPSKFFSLFDCPCRFTEGCSLME